MNTDIYETVVGFIVAACDVERTDITPETDILRDLKIDSIMLVEVVFDIEEKYEISVPLEEWQGEEFISQSGEIDFRMEFFVDGIEKLIAAKDAGEPVPLPIYKQQLSETE